MKADKFKLTNSFTDAAKMKAHAKNITDEIHSLGGINAVRVDPFENYITVDYNEEEVSQEDIQKKIKEANF